MQSYTVTIMLAKPMPEELLRLVLLVSHTSETLRYRRYSCLRQLGLGCATSFCLVIWLITKRMSWLSSVAEVLSKYKAMALPPQDVSFHQHEHSQNTNITSAVLHYHSLHVTINTAVYQTCLPLISNTSSLFCPACSPQNKSFKLSSRCSAQERTSA